MNGTTAVPGKTELVVRLPDGRTGTMWVPANWWTEHPAVPAGFEVIGPPNQEPDGCPGAQMGTRMQPGPQSDPAYEAPGAPGRALPAVPARQAQGSCEARPSTATVRQEG